MVGAIGRRRQANGKADLRAARDYTNGCKATPGLQKTSNRKVSARCVDEGATARQHNELGAHTSGDPVEVCADSTSGMQN